MYFFPLPFSVLHLFMMREQTGLVKSCCVLPNLVSFSFADVVRCHRRSWDTLRYVSGLSRLPSSSPCVRMTTYCQQSVPRLMRVRSSLIVMVSQRWCWQGHFLSCSPLFLGFLLQQVARLFCTHWLLWSHFLVFSWKVLEQALRESSL